MDDCMDVSSSTADQSIIQNSSVTGIHNISHLSSFFTKLCIVLDVLSRNPLTWTESDVVIWLKNCNLEQCVSVFQGFVNFKSFSIKFIQSMFFLLENEMDGSVLMDDTFDEAKIQELIPKMKNRLLFIKELKKLRFVLEINVFKWQ
jgi:hypothetical protein